MTEFEQNQDISDGSTAIQAGRDVNINCGLSTIEVKELLDTTVTAVSQQFFMGQTLANERLKEFEQRIIHQLDKKLSKLEAFSDPDFMYMLRQSAHQYARADDDFIHDTLINLISQRSQTNTRSRLSLSLNYAIEKSAVLTRNEFAELSLSFLLRYSGASSVRSIPELASHHEKFIIPLIDNISREKSSYNYLEAHSCAKISDIMHWDLTSLYTSYYAGLFNKGFEKDLLKSQLPPNKIGILDDLITSCLNDPSKFQLNGLSDHDFSELCAEKGLTNEETANLLKASKNTSFSKEDIILNLKPYVSRIDEVFDIWEQTPLINLSLTSVGITLGYANARILGIDADLSIWIQ